MANIHQTLTIKVVTQAEMLLEYGRGQENTPTGVGKT